MEFEQQILISIVSVFFIFFITETMKNLFYNTNGYSRWLRIQMTFGVITNLLITSLVLWYAFTEIFKYQEFIVMITLYVVMSIIGLNRLQLFSSKKFSVRDQWKYSSKYIGNFKISKQPKRIFESFQNTIKWLFILAYAGLATTLVAIDNAILMIIIGSICIFDSLVIYGTLKYFIEDKVNKTARYNELKRRKVSGEYDSLDNKTKKVVSLKALELYDELFTRSVFYKKSFDTNNAIVIEWAAEKDGTSLLKYDQVSRYLTDEKGFRNPDYLWLSNRYDLPLWK